MIHPDSHTSDWINTVSANNRNADKILIEKVIRALTLLEGLQESEMNFIFKGGTALMLMLPDVKRLSIDIDIIVAEKPDNLEMLLETIAKNKNFIRHEKQERKTKSKIEKAHYKFFYKPITNTRTEEEYILLDILYQENPYGKLVQETEIKSPLIQVEGAAIKVITPSREAILGDKLTAYAPTTTGIPYGVKKELEIIKQLYDIGNLFEQVNEIGDIKEVFQIIGKTELEYRVLDELTHDHILEDIYQTSLCICLRGKDGAGNFEELERGIRNIYNFIVSESFHIEKAITHASRAAYLSALLRKNTDSIKKYSSVEDVRELEIQQPANTKLNKLKKTNPEAFFYWYHTALLLG